MRLEHQIAHDWQVAMREGDRPRKRALSGLRAAILQNKIDTRRDHLEDGEIYDIILFMIQQRKETIRSVAGKRKIHFITKEIMEIMVLDPYLPESVI